MSHSQPRIAIIGTGFGGIGAAVQLRAAGFTQITLFEKADDVGGVWRDNTYPGAACDVPSHLYSFSFAPKRDWSRKFAGQAEILGYIRQCARDFGIRPLVRFNTEVRGAEWHEARACWQLDTTTGPFEAEVLVSACGQLNRPTYPRLKGLETFAGDSFHSARWNHDVDLRGRRVAVIGSGASAIQFVPEIAPGVDRLTLFQRSAPYVIPKPDYAYPAALRRMLDKAPGVQRLSRGAQYLQHEARALGFTQYRELMKLFEWSFRRQLNRQVQDPILRAKLTPDYPIGCKRILISNHYYAAMNRDNVHVETTALEEAVPQGLVTDDGRLHPADVLIYGTGFAATDFLAPMRIVGRQGQDLNRAWQDGAEAYLGITVSGFPNLFMLYGPNTNLGHNSIIFMLESQIAYLISGLRQMQQRGLKSLDVRTEVQTAFNLKLQSKAKDTIWDTGCTSWYKTADGKNTNNWPGFTFAYRQATRALRLKDYQEAA